MLRQGDPKLREMWWFRTDFYKLFTLSWLKIEVKGVGDNRNPPMCSTLPVKLPTVWWKAAAAKSTRIREGKWQSAPFQGSQRGWQRLPLSFTLGNGGKNLHHPFGNCTVNEMKWLFGRSQDRGTEVLMMLNINTITCQTVKKECADSC